MDFGKWRMVAGPINDFINAGVEVISASQRKFVWSLEAAPTCSFSIDAMAPDAAVCWELDHDVILYDDLQQKVFRGRIGGVNENFGSDRSTLDVQAVGYRSLLGRRILYSTDLDEMTFVQTDQSLIAWNLAAISQLRPGGNLGIQRGTGQTTGRLRDRTYEAGDIIGDLITNLGEVIDGFDWEVDADLMFNVYYPSLTNQTSVALDWGGMVQSVSRNWQSQMFANVVRGGGGVKTVEDAEGNKIDYPTTPVIRTTATVATTPEGRWETGLTWPDVLEQGTLVEHTEAELDYRSKRLADVSVKLRPDMWEGPDQLWLGDICLLQAPLRGRANIPGALTWRYVRVLEVHLSLADDGSTPDVELLTTEVILD